MAAKIKEEDLRLNLIIETGEAKVKLKQLNDAMDLNTRSIQELRSHLKQTRTVLAQAVPGTQNWKNLQEEVQRTQARLKELQAGGASVGGAFKNFFGDFAGKFTLASLAIKGVNDVLALGGKAIADMKTQTQAWGDAWNITVAGLNAGWKQLIANMAAGSETIKKSVREAAAAAREAAALRDELFERRNSLAIEEERAQQYINEQNAIAMDSSRSAKERVAALDLVMQKEEELAKLRTDIASQSLEAAKKELTARTSLGDEDLKQMIELYNQNRDFIKQGDEYNKLLKERDRLKKTLRILSSTNSGDISILESGINNVNAKIAEAGDETVRFAAIVRQYNLSNDDLVKNYVEGVKEMEHAETELTAAKQGQARRRGSLNKQIAADAKAATDKEYADNLQVIIAANNAELLEIKRQKAEKTISETEYKDKSEDLEIQFLSRKIELNKKYGKDTLELENELQNKMLEEELAAQQLKKDAAAFVASLETDKTEIALNAEEKRYEEEKKAFEKNKAAIVDQNSVVETIELNHQNNLRKIQLDAFNHRFELLKKQHDTELLQIKNDAGKEKLSVKNGSTAEKLIDEKTAVEVAKLEVSYLEEYLKELEALNLAGLKDEDVAEIKLKIQQVKQELNAAKEVINGDKEGAFSGTGKGNLFGVSESDWETLIGHLKEGKFAAEDLQSIISGIGGAASQGFALAAKAIDNTNKKEEAALNAYKKENEEKKKSLKARLDSGLMSQAQYDDEIARLQKEEEAREKEMQINQAMRQKKLSITQAIIDSSLAVIKTFAEWGWPAGIAPAAIMAGIGAAQVALIANEPVGYAEGGLVKRAQDGRLFNAKLSPARRGYVNSPTILVGEEGGEYVIPADGLQNPTLAPFIGTLETARRNGTLKSINFGAMPASVATISAFAAGGQTEPGSPSWPAYDSRNTRLLEKILEKMDEPIPAVAAVTGRNGIRRSLDKYERYRKNGRL